MAIDAWFSDLYERNYVLLYRIGRIFLGYNRNDRLTYGSMEF